jgi:hypothetical protein
MEKEKRKRKKKKNLKIKSYISWVKVIYGELPWGTTYTLVQKQGHMVILERM